MNNENILKIENLNSKVGTRYLLRNINWEVNRGDRWVVLGMNGCGKTTLLSIIAGYRAFTSGKLTIFGEQYNQENVLKLRKKIGFVSASFFDRYYRKETALEIILAGKFGSFGLDMAVSNSDVLRAKQLMKALRIGEKGNQVYQTMSKGERQNVLIARALFAKPELLILDEPCSGLDFLAREYVLELIQNLAESVDVTLIYVTHYFEEISPLFQDIFLLRRGFQYKIGKREEIFQKKVLDDFLEERIRITKNEQNNFVVEREK